MANKKGLLFLGGGSWDAYSIGTLEKLDNKYSIVVGVSTGCLLAPMIGLNEWEVIKSGYINGSACDMFDFKIFGFFPINSKGKIRTLPIIRTLLFGNKSIATTNVLRNTIDNNLPREYYEELKSKNIEILLGCRNYAQIPSKMHYFSSLVEEFEEFKDWMWCGANFPFFGSFVKKSWKDSRGLFHVGNWNGGGFIDYSGVEEFMNKDLDEIDIFINRVKVVEKLEGNRINNFIDNVTTTICAMNHTIESEYFYEKIKDLNKRGIKVNVYWIPKQLSNNPMSHNVDDITIWWEEGNKTALNKDRCETYLPIKSR